MKPKHDKLLPRHITEYEKMYQIYLDNKAEWYVTQKTICLKCGENFEGIPLKCPRCSTDLKGNYAVVDFLLTKKKEVHEIIEDITKFHDTEDPLGEDQRRKTRLEAVGYKVRFITNQQVMNLM